MFPNFFLFFGPKEGGFCPFSPPCTPLHLDIPMTSKHSQSFCNDMDISFLGHSQYSQSLTRDLQCETSLHTCIISISSIVWRISHPDLGSKKQLSPKNRKLTFGNHFFTFQYDNSIIQMLHQGLSFYQCWKEQSRYTYN